MRMHLLLSLLVLTGCAGSMTGDPAADIAIGAIAYSLVAIPRLIAWRYSQEPFFMWCAPAIVVGTLMALFLAACSPAEPAESGWWVEFAKGAGLGVLIFLALVGVIVLAALFVIRKIAKQEDYPDLW